MIYGRSITAFAPATVANVGLGFDFMGFAVTGAGDRVTISVSGLDRKTRLRRGGPFGSLIPADPEVNTAGVSARAFLDKYGEPGTGLDIYVEKNLPLGSGLGSSASSSAASVLALNEIFGNPFPLDELILFAMEGERAACGTAHADNVAPSLLGGFLIIRSYDPLDIIRLKCPDELYCAVIHPHIEVKTSDARRILKHEIPMGDVTRQCANVATFITGLIKEDFTLLERSMHDLLAEPRRINLIPGFEEARKAAMETGATGCGISGSGPSVFALCRGEEVAKPVSRSIQKAFMNAGLESDVFISPMNSPGACIVEGNGGNIL